PRSAEAGAVWPRQLVEAWSPKELPRATEEDETDPRRAWQIKDPEGDLEITIIWAPGPGDPIEAERQSALRRAERGDEEPEEVDDSELEEASDDEGDDEEGEDGDERPKRKRAPPEGWLLFGHTP